MSLGMGLNMSDFMDDTMESFAATRFQIPESRDSKGRVVKGAETESPHSVNVQPLSEQEINNLGIGADRVNDFRKIYVNDGDLYAITPQDEWEFDSPELVGIRFTSYKMDLRPSRSYCKAVVHRNDR